MADETLPTHPPSPVDWRAPIGAGEGSAEALAPRAAESSHASGSSTYSNADIAWWAAGQSPYAPPDPASATGPPWPRLVADGRPYTPPRLIRWPIVVGVILFAGWIAISLPFGNSSMSSSPSLPSSAPPYSFTANDAAFTATFPGLPQPSGQSVLAAPSYLYLYVSNLADHAVAVGYAYLATGPISLDSVITGIAAELDQGTVVSRTPLTYQGQPAEDAVISFSGGIGQLRAVMIGTEAYVLEAFGNSASSYAHDYNVLVDSFNSTSAPTSPMASP